MPFHEVTHTHRVIKLGTLWTILDSVLWETYKTQKLRYLAQNSAIGSHSSGVKILEYPPFISSIGAHLHFITMLPNYLYPNIVLCKSDVKDLFMTSGRVYKHNLSCHKRIKRFSVWPICCQTIDKRKISRVQLSRSLSLPGEHWHFS